jgi:photosystem II stability/assembly factor-like uncharacterized protein
MMKTINKQRVVQKASIVLAFLYIGQIAWATDWLAVTSGTTKNLYGTYFKNDTTIFVMGASGTLLKSVDKGNTWSALSSGVTTGLRDMCFLNDTLGYLVGDNGVILKTINDGGSWTSISSGTTETLRKIYIKNDSTLFVVGYTGTILKCLNLGSWVNSGSLNSGSIMDILFVNDSTGYAVGDGFSVKSTDGGATWSYLTSGGTFSFRTICSPDSNKIFMTDSYGILYKTIDVELLT